MIHETIMEDVRRSEVWTLSIICCYGLTHWRKDIMRRFCAELPENRILHGADDFDALVEKDRYRKSYKVESTGATLTYHSSLAILAHYASSLVGLILPKDQAVLLTVFFSNTKRKCRHKCTTSFVGQTMLLFARSCFRKNHQFVVRLASLPRRSR